MLTEGALLWEPSEALSERSGLATYMRWLDETHGLTFATYDALWRWSVEDLEAFWGSLFAYLDVASSTPYERVLAERRMPGARWFPGATLNYARHAFRTRSDTRPALLFASETHPLREMSWGQLEAEVTAVASALHAFGVGRGDRVAGYLPNIPEAVVAFLACASIGAVWSCCSPDFGTPSVVDRFRQIAPKVLIAADGYTYNGKPYDRLGVIGQIQAELPSLTHTVVVGNLLERPSLDSLRDATLWDGLPAPHDALTFEDVPFDHPLWVLYSSGTTSLPKPIVHGHGGVLLEHLKVAHLHRNLGPGDRFFWYTTTSWMMWNVLVSALLVGATPVLYDGSPGYPDLSTLWRLAEEARVTSLGAGAAYFSACMKANLRPADHHDLTPLTALGSTGSPLPLDAYSWIYDAVKPDLWLAASSGGTDVASALVGGCPLLPVYAGEMQCRYLGAKVETYDEKGKPVIDQTGELVISEPMPSMPTAFWNDTGDRRYIESYFSRYPGVWRHGDWARITPRGTCVIYGRSDATINRHGVRMGTSEIYRSVEALDEVADSLVVDLEYLGRPSFMPLFVALKPGITLDDALRDKIRGRIRADLSARHLPDAIYAIPEVPRTLNGKKLEVPVRKILMGATAADALSRDTLSNPASLDFFVEMARQLDTARQGRLSL